MKRLNIYLTAALLLSFVACNKEIATTAAGDITIDASIGAMTKVSYDGASTSFTAGDQIAVYAWMGDATAVPDTRVVDGVRNTLGTDGKWTPATQMRWKTVTDAHYFLGVYPAKDVTNFTADAYTLDPAAYTASDLLIATNFGTGNAGLKASSGTVPLTFDHAMAKLNVNLKFRSQWNATPTVTSVTVNAKKTATVNYLTKAVTATGGASEVDIPAAATAATGYALSFSGLQVPQSGVTTVTVTIAGKTYVYESATDIPLESGKYTTLGLIVGKDKLELGSISVTDWEAGTTLPDGNAVLTYRHNGYEYVDMGEVDINGVTKHLYWATCNVGAGKPWDYGDFYAWGATSTQTSYGWADYPFMQAGQSDWKHITMYTYADGYTSAIWYDGDGNFIGDGKTSFADNGYADDAARQSWGGDWRIPTDAEWTALRDDALYDWVWTDDYLGDGSNHAGRIVTRKSGPCSGNSIFLPAAGYLANGNPYSVGSYGFYWSSSIGDYSGSAWNVYFSSNSLYRYDFNRFSGFSLRPVFSERYPLVAADVATIDIGRVLAADGNIYADAAQASAAGTEARAVIAYVGSETGSATYNHGLAIALADESDSYCAWSNNISEFAGVSTSMTMTDHKAFLNGITDTETLITKYGDGYAAKKAKNYQNTVASPIGTSGWFLPSSGQWLKFFEAAGVDVANWTSWGSSPDGASSYTKVHDLMETVATGSSVKDDWYWSSSEYYDYLAVFVYINSTDGVALLVGNKGGDHGHVRSFLAF